MCPMSSIHPHKVIKKFRDVADTADRSAYTIELIEQEAAKKNTDGRKPELGLENARTIAKTKYELKQEMMAEEKKAVEEFKKKSEVVYKRTPSPEMEIEVRN